MCQPEPSKSAIIQSASVSFKAFSKSPQKNRKKTITDHSALIRECYSKLIVQLLIV